MKCSLVWFRHDLRVEDHEPLYRAVSSGLPVVGVYCFDPREYRKTSFGFSKTGFHRARFIRESVADLREKLNALGSNLIVRLGKPEEVIADLSKSLEISEVHYHYEIGSEEEAVEALVKMHCPTLEFHSYYGHNLIHPDDLPFAITNVPNVFSHFRRQVEKKLIIREMFPTPTNLQSIKIEDMGTIPSEGELGLTDNDFNRSFIYIGGSTEGLRRLGHYFFEGDHLKNYKETRNGMLEVDDSSKLSPYLAHGCLSPRYVYWQLKQYEQERVSNDSTYWLFFEMLWRDYFWLIHKKFGNCIFQQGGLFEKNLTWSKDENAIATWINGQTGFPLVDANMIELKTTGMMSNRGRQNVASFLSKNLGIDWRIGAEWFESCLIDYDVSSNYGNWGYVAGVGTDSLPFRTFNVTKQGKDYDPEGKYIKKWLPTLSHIPAKQVYDVPSFTIFEQSQYNLILGKDYPFPIIDLAESYRENKLRFQQASKR